MVEFNVVWGDHADFHRSTDGSIYLPQQASSGAVGRLFEALSCANVDVKYTTDIDAVLHGKLLLNLINPVNALSAMPVTAMLTHHGYRAVWAAMVDEAIAAYSAAKLPFTMARVPPRLLSTVLRLPTPIFQRVAAKLAKLDPRVRSSMLQDLDHGRLTEIEQLSGYVCSVGRRHGIATPVNDAILQLVHCAESRSSPVSHSPQELTALIPPPSTAPRWAATALVAAILLWWRWS